MRGIDLGKPLGIHARSWLCALALGSVSVTGHAAYANAVPPQGWSPGTGAGATYRAAANESWLSSTVRTNASLNVGGRAIQVPATMRLAANAPRFAARFLFGNPAVALASVALVAWIGSQGIQWDSLTNSWVKINPNGGEPQLAVGFIFTNPPGLQGPYAGYTAACTAGVAYVLSTYPERNYINTSNQSFCQVSPNNGSGSPEPIGLVPMGGTISDPIKRPIGDDEFENDLAPIPLPDLSPNALPIPLPVELPRINPIPSPSGQPQPIRMPTGDPYRVPNSDPAEYRRPAVDIVPSPRIDAPWRVDVQPRDIPVPDLTPRPLPPPVPIPPPVPLPPPDPDAPPVPEVDPNAPPEPGEDKQPDLCEKNPDILACSKPELDTPDQEIPKREFAVTFAAETLFGGGSCPANKTMSLRGQQITVWDFQRTCDLVETYLKPLLLTLALFSAFIILSPGKD